MNRCFAVALIFVCSAYLISCTHSLPGVDCEAVVEIFGPRDAGYTIDRACQRYLRATDSDPAGARKALQGTSVKVMERGHHPPCNGAPGCARITRSWAHVYVAREGWRPYLSHEIYHVLLARMEPNLPVHRHHARMRELGLCGGGVCGWNRPTYAELGEPGCATVRWEGAAWSMAGPNSSTSPDARAASSSSSKTPVEE